MVLHLLRLQVIETGDMEADMWVNVVPPLLSPPSCARFQELDLSTQCLMGQDSSREEPWTDTVELTLKKEGDYQKV